MMESTNGPHEVPLAVSPPEVFGTWIGGSDEGVGIKGKDWRNSGESIADRPRTVNNPPASLPFAPI